MARFRVLVLNKIKTDVYEQLLRTFPQLEEENETLWQWLDELIEDGFDTRQSLFEAAHILMRIGHRTDTDAAEARAVATALLRNNDHPPMARLDFLRAQNLTRPKC